MFVVMKALRASYLLAVVVLSVSCGSAGYAKEISEQSRVRGALEDATLPDGFARLAQRSVCRIDADCLETSVALQTVADFGPSLDMCNAVSDWALDNSADRQGFSTRDEFLVTIERTEFDSDTFPSLCVKVLDDATPGGVVIVEGAFDHPKHYDVSGMRYTLHVSRGVADLRLWDGSGIFKLVDPRDFWVGRLLLESVSND